MATYERPRIYDAMLRQTFDIAVNALLGLELSNEEGRLDEMFSTFNDLVSNIFCLPYSIPGCGYVKVSPISARCRRRAGRGMRAAQRGVITMIDRRPPPRHSPSKITFFI